MTLHLLLLKNGLKTLAMLSALMFSVVMAAEDETPESLVTSYFYVLRDQGLMATSQFMHPEALHEFRFMLLPVYQAESDSGQRSLLDMTFGQSIKIEEVKDLSPAEFFDGFMSFVHVQMGGQNITFDKLEVVGSVSENDIKHVLARITVGADDLAITSMEVLSLTPYEDTWRLQLTGEIEGLAKALGASLNK